MLLVLTCFVMFWFRLIEFVRFGILLIDLLWFDFACYFGCVALGVI